MENKKLICEELCKVLRLTRNNHNLVALRYEEIGNLEEIVVAEYKDQNGHRNGININVTADSGAAMIRDIMRYID